MASRAVLHVMHEGGEAILAMRVLDFRGGVQRAARQFYSNDIPTSYH